MLLSAVCTYFEDMPNFFCREFEALGPRLEPDFDQSPGRISTRISVPWVQQEVMVIGADADDDDGNLWYS